MPLFSFSKTIYYPGNTLTKFFPDLVLNWKSVLSDFGITFEIVEDINTGWALWDQGYHKEFEQHKAHLTRRLEKMRVKTIITSSPEALYMLKTFYPQFEAKHTTQVAHENIGKVQRFNTGEAAFHDNTTQVRRNNIVKEPREILQKAGFDIKEFDENKQETQCLGTSTGLVNNSPRLATKLAMRRVRLAPTKTIITDSPEDYIQLKRQTNANVLELSEVLVEI